jgi:hypothetical protein
VLEPLLGNWLLLGIMTTSSAMKELWEAIKRRMVAFALEMYLATFLQNVFFS